MLAGLEARRAVTIRLREVLPQNAATAKNSIIQSAREMLGLGGRMHTRLCSEALEYMAR